MNLSKEVKTALLVIAGIALFISGYSFLKSNPIWQSSRTFYAVYQQVAGLVPGTSVTINGLTVGKIQRIKLLKNTGNLLVSFTVEDDFPFSKNSKAVIYEASFIGGKALAVQLALDGATPAKSGDTLQTTYKQSFTEAIEAKLEPLQDNIQSLIVHTDSLVHNINKVFNAKNRNNLEAGLANLNQSLASFNKTTSTLDILISQNQQRLTNTIDNFEMASKNLTTITDAITKADIEKFITDLQSTVQGLNKMMGGIASGEGSLGKLMNEDGLYQSLESASSQLELLLQDMRLNPKRYVHFSLFGKRSKEYQTPKNDPAAANKN